MKFYNVYIYWNLVFKIAYIENCNKGKIFEDSFIEPNTEKKLNYPRQSLIKVSLSVKRYWKATPHL